jgi:hypothetical protein
MFVSDGAYMRVRISTTKKSPRIARAFGSNG